MLVREIQPIRLGLNYSKIKPRIVENKPVSYPLSRESVSFRGYYSPPVLRETKTNYKAYSASDGRVVDLVMKPYINFENYGGEDKLFPGMVARNSCGSYGNFKNVYMKNADFTDSSFVATDFNGAKIHNSTLVNCNFSEADMRNAKFARSDFKGSLCKDSDFMYSNLQDAKFNGVNFQNANLALTNIIGADFSGAKNLPTLAPGAVYNKNTNFPVGYSPELAGMSEIKSGADLQGAYLHSMQLKSDDEFGFDEYKDLNLAGSILNKSRFVQVDMQNSVFDRSKMEKVIFDFCALNNCSFKDANLERACFKNSDLGNSKFDGTNTNLKYANFIGSDLSGTDINKLSPEQLQSALFSPATTLPEGMTVEDAIELGMKYVVDTIDFTDQNLYGINFKNFKFSKYGINEFDRARFERANLHRTNFDGASLKECCFDKASLKYSSLQGADCEGASFVGTNMLCADIQGTNFKFADLSGANMKCAQFDGETDFTNAKYDENTVFPDRFSPKEHNMVFTPNARGAKK